MRTDSTPDAPTGKQAARSESTAPRVPRLSSRARGGSPPRARPMRRRPRKQPPPPPPHRQQQVSNAAYDMLFSIS